MGIITIFQKPTLKRGEGGEEHKDQEEEPHRLPFLCVRNTPHRIIYLALLSAPGEGGTPRRRPRSWATGMSPPPARHANTILGIRVVWTPRPPCSTSLGKQAGTMSCICGVPCGRRLPGLLRGGVLVRHHRTSQPAGTALRPCMRASGAAAHTAIQNAQGQNTPAEQKNARILLVNPQVLKLVCPICLL
jgi:hypothetical protein